jgi:hypothetical protein
MNCRRHTSLSRAAKLLAARLCAALALGALLAAPGASGQPQSSAPSQPASRPAGTNLPPHDSELSLTLIALNHAMQRQDWSAVSNKLAEAERRMPANLNTAKALGIIRFKMLAGKNDADAAYQLARKLGELDQADEKLANELAWDIATLPGLNPRDLSLAEQLALQARAAAEGKPAQSRCGVLDTLARIRYLQGRHAEAIACEEQAVALAEGQLKDILKKALENYRKAAAPAK